MGSNFFEKSLKKMKPFLFWGVFILMAIFEVDIKY